MFEKITDHIHIRKYQHYTDRPNIGYIRGTNRALLFDAGNSEANVALLKRELADAGLPMPELVALSHWHWTTASARPSGTFPSSPVGRRTNSSGR